MAYISAPAFWKRRRATTSSARRPRSVSTYKTPASRAAKKYPLARTAASAIVKYAGPIATTYRKYRRKRREAMTVTVPQGVGSTFSRCSYGKKLMPREIYNYWKTNQKYSVSNTTSYKLSTTAYGTQAINTIFGLTGGPFADDLTRLGITDAYARTSTTLIYNKVTDIITYTNVELTTTYLHIYELVPRQNLNGSSNYPEALWAAGLNEEYGAAGGSAVMNYPYEKPFRSKRFCLNYLVKKVIQIELAPGESHKHTSTYYVNRPVHGQVQLSYSIGKNFTNIHMHVASGTPINDATNKTLVSTSTVAIDIVMTREWEFGADARPRTQTFFDNSLNTITSAKVISPNSAVPDVDA